MAECPFYPYPHHSTNVGCTCRGIERGGVPLSDEEIDQALKVREKQFAKRAYHGSFDSVRDQVLVDQWRLLATVEALRKMIRERDEPTSADYDLRRRVHELADRLIDEEIACRRLYLEGKDEDYRNAYALREAIAADLRNVAWDIAAIFVAKSNSTLDKPETRT